MIKEQSNGKQHCLRWSTSAQKDFALMVADPWKYCCFPLFFLQLIFFLYFNFTYQIYLTVSLFSSLCNPRCDKFEQRLVLYPKLMGRYFYLSQFFLIFFFLYLIVYLFKAFHHKLLFHCKSSSAIFEMGNTKVIAAVYGPREVLYNHFTCLCMFVLVNLRWIHIFSKGIISFVGY